MDEPRGRARFPARMTVQVTQELKDGLQELARRTYGGDLQGLLRETLQARLESPGKDQSEMSQVLQTLERIRQDAAERTKENRAQLDRLQDVADHMNSTLNLQASDSMGIRDRIEKILTDISEVNNRARRLEQAWRDEIGE